MVFPVVMYGCKNWTIKKAEHRRIDAFQLWCWRRLLRVPWTARRSKKSILKEISPGCSLEGLILKLKLQHFGHLMQRADSFEKTLIREGNGTPLQYSYLENPMDGGAWKAAVHEVALQSMRLRRIGHDWATSLSLFTFTHWRRRWQPTPVFLPEESQGWGSVVGCRLWGCTESDTTEVT